MQAQAFKRLGLKLLYTLLLLQAAHQVSSAPVGLSLAGCLTAQPMHDKDSDAISAVIPAHYQALLQYCL